MVPLEGIQKAYLRMAYRRVHYLINPRHREGVLWTSFVQVCEVYTHPPLPILLLYYHCISQLLRVENFLNSPSLLKLHHLVFDSVRMILR